jgi:hypothetical protein
MQRGGNQESGFAIHYDGATNVIHLEAWGFWDASLSADFGDSMIVACRGARPRFTIVARCIRLNPQRPEGQEAFTRVMKEAAACRVDRVLVAVQNSITKLQFIRLLKENATLGWQFFPSESAAQAALGAR